jgi:hypothetical protein
MASRMRAHLYRLATDEGGRVCGASSPANRCARTSPYVPSGRQAAPTQAPTMYPIEVHHRRGARKFKRGRPPGPRMKCGWGCGAALTELQMRALHHMPESGRRPPTTRTGERGTQTSGVAVRRMLCGWRCGWCGCYLTANRMGADFTVCQERLTASGPPTWVAHAERLTLQSSRGDQVRL